MLAKLKKAFKILWLTLLSLVVVFGLFWVAGPQILKLQHPENIVLINYEKDYQKGIIYFSQFLPTDKKVQLVQLNEIEAVPNVLGNYGEYRLESIYPLLALENQSESYIQAAFSQAVGVSVDQVIIIHGTDFKISQRGDLQKTIRKELFSGQFSLRKNKKLVELLFFLRQVPTENYRVEERISSLEELPENLEPVYFDGCSISIVNTTPTPGLATQVSQLVEQSGGLVVRISDQNTPYQLSTFSVDPEQVACQAITEKITHIFAEEVLIQDQPELRQQERADLVIMIGQDLAQLISGEE